MLVHFLSSTYVYKQSCFETPKFLNCTLYCNVRKKCASLWTKKNPSEEEQPSGAGDRKKRSFNKWNQLLFSKLNEPWRRCGNTALISWQSSRLKLTFNLLMNSLIGISLLTDRSKFWKTFLDEEYCCIEVDKHGTLHV